MKTKSCKTIDHDSRDRTEAYSLDNAKSHRKGAIKVQQVIRVKLLMYYKSSKVQVREETE